jgi:solute carrier family 25 (mitochondrial 2-oxodicarboxylate transporter), member 21
MESNNKRSGPFWTLNLLSSAAIATATIMYPVDVLRALKMANETLGAFVKSHGIKGLFSQGVAAEIGRASMMRVSKFFFFPRICNAFYGKDVKRCNPVEKAIAGIFSAVPEILVISPFEVAKVGLQLDEKNHYKNSISAFIRARVSKSGVSSIYHGWAGMQYRQCSWTAVYFSTLSLYREKSTSLCTQIGIPQFGNLLGGFMAGMSGVIFNCPGDVVRTVVQKKGFANTNQTEKLPGIGLASISEHIREAKSIFKKNPRGLYAGFGVKCFHLGFSGALMSALIPVFRDFMDVEYEI